jgi:hypothetical protein
MRSLLIALLLIVGAAGIVGGLALWVLDYRSARFALSAPETPTFVGFEPPKLPPEVDAGNARVAEEYSRAVRLRRWSSGVSWGGVFLTGVVSIIAAAAGIRGSGSGDGDAVNQLAEQQRQSTLLVRLLAVLVALGTLSNVVSQRLEQDATRRVTTGNEINKAILDSMRVYVDPKAEEGAKLYATQVLRQAMQQQW